MLKVTSSNSIRPRAGGASWTKRLPTWSIIILMLFWAAMLYYLYGNATGPAVVKGETKSVNGGLNRTYPVIEKETEEPLAETEEENDDEEDVDEEKGNLFGDLAGVSEDEIKLKLRWIEYKDKYAEYTKNQQYCLLWCSKDDPIFQGNITDLYPDLTEQEILSIRKGDNYHNDEIQEFNEEQNEMRCCQIVTAKSFKVLYDSRPAELQDDEITMVTMGTYSRIDGLIDIRKRWAGPVVFLMYGSDYNHGRSAYENEADLNETAHREAWPNTLVLSYVARYEVDEKVLREGVNLMRSEKGNQTGLRPDFPINALRNVIMDMAKSRFVFANDIDFLPDENAYEYLKSPEVFRLLAGQDRSGLVFPHFERRPCTENWTEYDYPMTFQDLEKQLMDAWIRPFHCELFYWQETYPQVFNFNAERISPECKILKDKHQRQHYLGVRNTNYGAWLDHSRRMDNSFYLAKMNHSNDLPNYEPFFVQNRVNVDGPSMRYNEVFVSRFYNKASYVAGLRVDGYQFYGATGHFLIHRDHPIENWEDKSRSSKQLLETMRFTVHTMLAKMQNQTMTEDETDF